MISNYKFFKSAAVFLFLFFQTQFIFAQNKLDIGIYNVGAGVLEVRMKPNFTASSQLLTSVIFTVEYPTSYAVTLSVPSASPYGLYIDQHCDNGTGMRKYFFTTTQTPSISFTSGTEIVLVTINVSQTGIGSGTMTLGQTTTNCSNQVIEGHYLEVGSVNYTGSISPSSATNVSLPLTLLKFNAAPQTDNVVLNWLTADEKNFRNFDIQRSTDGVNFSTVGTTNAKGDGAYSYLDNTVAKGQVYYYRLKMIDIDGSFTFSLVQSAEIYAAASVKLFPNPTRNNITLLLENKNSDQSESHIQIATTQGQICFDQKVNLTQGENTFTLPTENLPAGVFIVFVQLNNAQWQYKITKF